MQRGLLEPAKPKASARTTSPEGLGKFKTFINKGKDSERRLYAMEFLDLVRELEVDVGEVMQKVLRPA